MSTYPARQSPAATDGNPGIALFSDNEAAYRSGLTSARCAPLVSVTRQPVRRGVSRHCYSFDFGTARQQHERTCNCEFFHHSSCMKKRDCGIKALMSPAFPGSERNLILTIIFVNYYPENKFVWCMIRDSCFKPSEFRGYIHVMAANTG